MEKQYSKQRKWSAIVAVSLALMVTFMAALSSFGDTSEEELIVYDIKSSLDRAYEEVIEEEFDFELPQVATETIKVYDANDNLILKVVKEKSGVVADEKAQKVINKAEFLAAYSNTAIYRISE